MPDSGKHQPHSWIYPTKEIADPTFKQTDPPTPPAQIPTVKVEDRDRPPISCGICKVEHVVLTQLSAYECPGADHKCQPSASPLRKGNCRHCGKPTK